MVNSLVEWRGSSLVLYKRVLAYCFKHRKSVPYSIVLVEFSEESTDVRQGNPVGVTV